MGNTQNIDLATEKIVKTKTKTAGELYAEINGLKLTKLTNLMVDGAKRFYQASREGRAIPLPQIHFPLVTTTSTAIASKLASTTTNLGIVFANNYRVPLF